MEGITGSQPRRRDDHEGRPDTAGASNLTNVYMCQWDRQHVVGQDAIGIALCLCLAYVAKGVHYQRITVRVARDGRNVSMLGIRTQSHLYTCRFLNPSRPKKY